jgi:hypothetical protein
MIDFFVANKGECGMAKPTEKQVKLLEGFGCDVPDGRRKAWRDIVHAGLSERVEAQGLHGVPNELRRAVAERESPERTEFSRRAAAFLSTSGIRVGSVVDRLGKMKVVVEMASARKIGIVNTMMPLCHNSIEAGSCVPGTIDFFPAFTLVANPPSGFVHIHCTGFFPEVEDPTADRKTFKHGDLHNFILSGINPEDRAEWGGFGTVVRVVPARALAAAFMAAKAQRPSKTRTPVPPFCSACGGQTTRRNPLMAATKRCKACVSGKRMVPVNGSRHCTQCGISFTPVRGVTNQTRCAVHAQIKSEKTA